MITFDSLWRLKDDSLTIPGEQSAGEFRQKDNIGSNALQRNDFPSRVYRYPEVRETILYAENEWT